jgi:hypothetical protein
MNYSSDYNHGGPTREEEQMAAEKQDDRMDAESKRKDAEMQFWVAFGKFENEVGGLFPKLVGMLRGGADMWLKTKGGVQVPPVEGWDSEPQERVFPAEKSEDPEQLEAWRLFDKIWTLKGNVTDSWQTNFIKRLAGYRGKFSLSPKQISKIKEIAMQQDID